MLNPPEEVLDVTTFILPLTSNPRPVEHTFHNKTPCFPRSEEPFCSTVRFCTQDSRMKVRRTGSSCTYNIHRERPQLLNCTIVCIFWYHTLKRLEMDHNKVWMGLYSSLLRAFESTRVGLLICTVTALLLMFTPMPPPGSLHHPPYLHVPRPRLVRELQPLKQIPEKDDKPVKQPPINKWWTTTCIILRRRLRRPSDSRVKLERATFDDFVANGFRPWMITLNSQQKNIQSDRKTSIMIYCTSGKSLAVFTEFILSSKGGVRCKPVTALSSSDRIMFCNAFTFFSNSSELLCDSRLCYLSLILSRVDPWRSEKNVCPTLPRKRVCVSGVLLRPLWSLWCWNLCLLRSGFCGPGAGGSCTPARYFFFSRRSFPFWVSHHFITVKKNE